LDKNLGIQYIAENEGEFLGFATLYFSFSTTRADKITIMNDWDYCRIPLFDSYETI
jgi:hypothetical protein